jgi:hypothetical protein
MGSVIPFIEGVQNDADVNHSRYQAPYQNHQQQGADIAVASRAGCINGFVSGHGFSRAAKSRNFQGL